MSPDQSPEVTTPQDWWRHNISYHGNNYFHKDQEDGSLITIKGLARGNYTLRLALETEDQNDDVLISIEPVGKKTANNSAFRVSTATSQKHLILPLVLETRSRIRIQPCQTTGAFRATWSVLPSSHKTALHLLRQWTRNAPAKRRNEQRRKGINTTKDEIRQRSLELLSGKKIKPVKSAGQLKRQKIKASHLQSFDSHLRKQDPEYQHYLDQIEPSLRASKEKVKEWTALNPDAPIISIILPTYNTHAEHLEQCINSIRNQYYPFWELCICDDCSTETHVKEILERHKKEDERIKIKFSQENGHICKASNEALQLATGSFAALVDHDDLITEDALYWVAREIQKRPDANLIYSDEDKINNEGVRSSPHFKPSFNLDLLFAYNFISHLGVYRTDLIKSIGGFRLGLEGSQDHDLALRVLLHSNAEQIIHIPRVLYHWRMHEDSTAINPGSKDYTTQKGLRAIQEFLDVQHSNGGAKAKVVSVAANRFRCIWEIPNGEPRVELIIPTRDKVEILRTAVESILLKTNYKNFSITIVDNQSCEAKTQQFFKSIQKKHPTRVKVIKYNKKFNYSAINNYAVRKTDAEIIGLVNNDVEAIDPEWLTEMVSHTIRPDVGCVGAKLFYSNDTIQHGGVLIGIGEVAGHAHKYFPKSSSGYVDRLIHTQQMSAVTAACLLVRRELYEQVGGLNEKDLTIAFNDVDLCLRIHERGYRNIFTPHAQLYHHESISRGSENTPEKQMRFNKEVKYMLNQYAEKGKTKLPCDIFYNPNLTRDHENFTINKNLKSVKNGLDDRQRHHAHSTYYQATKH